MDTVKRVVEWGQIPSEGEAAGALAYDYPMHLELERIWFPTVKVRQLTGHVQGVALHHDPSRKRFTLFTSLSDFPRGWGGLLINDNLVENELAVGMESSSLPQGNHPGGIGIVDDYLAVPIEGGREGGHKRHARLYLYDISEPFYPIQVASLSELSANGGLTAFDQDPADSSKASAAGIAPIPGRDASYLIVVLSQGRYLRFIEMDTSGDKPVLTPRRFLDAGLVYADEWPESFTDNVSLVAVDGRLHLFLFSVKLFTFPTWVRIPRYGTLPPLLPRHNATHVVTTFELDLDAVLGTVDMAGTALNPGPSWPVVLPPSRGFRDWLRPGFRWGASAGVYGGELGVLTAEYFGNERSRNHDVQYLQFATSFPDILQWPDHEHGAPGTDDELETGLKIRQMIYIWLAVFLLLDTVAWLSAIALFPKDGRPLRWLVYYHALIFGTVANGFEKIPDLVGEVWDRLVTAWPL